MSDNQYPNLKELATGDLIALLTQYVNDPVVAELDREFIKEIQAELKTRRDVGR